MNAWAVLGILPGSDRDAVRRAYAAKLKQTNPEDDPAGFMKLREAYEWVLRWGLHDATAADDDDAEEDADEDEAGDDWGDSGDAMGFGGTGIRNPRAIIEDRQDRPLDPRWADADDEADVPPPVTPDRWREPPETEYTPPERTETEWAEQPDFDPEQRSRGETAWGEDGQDENPGPLRGNVVRILWEST